MALTAALTRKHTPVNMYTPVLQPPSLGVTHRLGALVVHTGPQLLFGLISDSHLHGPGAVSLGTFLFLLILPPPSLQLWLCRCELRSSGMCAAPEPTSGL